MTVKGNSLKPEEVMSCYITKYIYLYCIPLNASACHAQNQTLGKLRPFQESQNNV